MKKYRISVTENFITTSEAYFGNIVVNKNDIIIPYCNIFLADNIIDEFPNESYVNFCYLIFKDVSSIIWDYEIKMLIDKKFECYGGENFFLDKYSEFWVSFKSCDLVLLEDISLYSKIPFSKKDKQNLILMENFFKKNNAKDLI